MKHLRLLKQFLLLFALIVGSSSVWGQEEVTLSISDYASDNDWENETAYTDAISINSDITVSCVSGGNNGKYYSSNNSWRHYESNSGAITITTTNGTLNSITFNYGRNNNGVLIYDNTEYASGNECTEVEGETTATFTVGHSSGTKAGNVQITSIVVIYTPASSSTDPSITANNVDIAYNATGGNIAFTLNSAGTEGTISASTQDTWITLGNQTTSPISFTCSANEANTARTATVTLTYTYNTNETVTKNVTITQAAAPVVFSTIPALFAAATSTATDVNVTFNNWVVSGVSTNGKNVFVTDGTNGFVIYSSSDQSSTYSVGDILSGTAVSCSLKKNNGYAQISVDANDLTINTGGTVTAANIALANLAGVNTGALVSYENLTCSVDNSGSTTKYYLSDGTNTVQLYNSLYAFSALVDGKKYNITGIYQQYNSTKEILPRSANDIVEVVSTEPNIDVSETSIAATAAETEGIIEVTYTAIESNPEIVWYSDANATTTANKPSWISASFDNSNNVEYLINANDGEARTAYLKIYGLDADANDVYSELITITQAKYVEATSYSLATTVTPGKHYIIVGLNNNEYKAMGEQRDNNRGAVAITVNNNTASVANDAGVYEVRIDVDDATGHYVLFDEAYNSNNGGYLYAAQGTGSGNNMKTEAILDSEGNGAWTIEINATTGVATIKATNPNIDRNTLRYNYNSGNSIFSCYKSGQKDVYLFERNNDDSPEQTTITISPATSKTYTTFCRAIDLDFTNVSGIEAYVVSNMSASSATITQVFTLPAGEGAILKRTDNGASESFDIPFAESADAIATNYMVGVTKATDMSDVANAYILKEGLFYECSGGTLAAGKAYLNDANGAWANSEAPSFSLIVDGETTGINVIDNGQLTIDNVYYDLSGRRVAEPTKGIFILNGKKFVVK